MYSLASKLRYGLGAPKNFGEAAIWYRKAVEAGNHVENYLAQIYEEGGPGLEKDTTEAAPLVSESLRVLQNGAPTAESASANGRSGNTTRKEAAFQRITSRPTPTIPFRGAKGYSDAKRAARALGASDGPRSRSRRVRPQAAKAGQ